MPLSSELFGPSILHSWEVFKLAEDAPYSVQADVTWASVEAYHEALASEKGQILVEELNNCSKERPVVMFKTFVRRNEA